MAELLKLKPEEDAQSPLAQSTGEQPQTTTSPQTAQPTAQLTLESSPRHISQRATNTLHLPQRDISSSIASNLASARGIPSNRQRRANYPPTQPLPLLAESRVTSQLKKSNFGLHEPTSPLAQDRDKSQKPTLSPSGPRISNPDLNLTSPSRDSTAVPRPVATASSDDAFSRFYNTFGNLISTLSAPLAFAGLPLVASESSEPTPPEKPTQKVLQPTSTRAHADPDLTRIFSRAALRAVRDENGGFMPTESFYVVPTSGGTMSYAGMLSHARNSSNMTEEDEAEFVDARETPRPVSPGLPRRRADQRSGTGPGRKGGGIVPGSKTWEELAVENESLKAVALDLGDRLRAFELGAQKSSLALHASMRAFSSPTESGVGGRVPHLPSHGSVKVLEDRIKELESEMKLLQKENSRLSRENRKFMNVIERYRERWEVLKSGAREKLREDEGGKANVDQQD